MPTYIAVDSTNHWLAYGEFDTPEECLMEAKRASNYEPEADFVYVYEIVNERTFLGGS